MSRLADELRAVLGAREERRQPRFEPSAAAIEEEAASHLYGERTGTVHASPKRPPIDAAAGARSRPGATGRLSDSIAFGLIEWFRGRPETPSRA